MAEALVVMDESASALDLEATRLVILGWRHLPILICTLRRGYRETQDFLDMHTIGCGANDHSFRCARPAKNRTTAGGVDDDRA